MPPKKSSVKVSKAKSSKKEASSSVKKSSKKAAPKKEVTKATKSDKVALLSMFEELMFYSSKSGDKWASMAYSKVHKALTNCKTEITSGADVKHLAAVGAASVQKIDEFLSTGKVKKLDEMKELYGPLPEMSTSIVKSGGAGGEGKKSAKGKKKPLSAADKKKIAAAKKNFEMMSGDKLKAFLAANNQTKSGPKADLVERCAQGSVLGAIPLCPLCFAGKLRFDCKTGEYRCPGHMDDDEFKPCVFKSFDVIRTPWME